MVYYACYGYQTDDTAEEDDPRWRVPYVTELLTSVAVIDGEPAWPDTWPDSGPFDLYEAAWLRAKQIAIREYCTSWEEN